MKQKTFILDARLRKKQMRTGVFFILISFIFLIANFFRTEKDIPLLFLMYLIQGFSFVLLAYRHYYETTVQIKNNELIVKWTNSFKKKKFNADAIKNIDINRIFLSIYSENEEDYKYSLQNFENDKRKELLSFLRESFSNKLTVNSK